MAKLRIEQGGETEEFQEQVFTADKRAFTSVPLGLPGAGCTTIPLGLLICYGVLKEDEGVIDKPIGRHPTDRKKMAINERNGKPAVTHYRVLERFGNYTYIECQLETGRTHQIRVHMASIGHPLLGDAVYGPKKCPVKNLQGQTLHAMVLGFIHPHQHHKRCSRKQKIKT